MVRVTAAGFVIAPLQLGIVAVDKLGDQLQIGAIREAFGDVDDGRGVEAAGPRIEPDRQRSAILPGEHFAHQRAQQADREVVDRLPAEVFQHAQTGGLARPGHARNQHDLLPLAHPSASLELQFLWLTTGSMQCASTQDRKRS